MLKEKALESKVAVIQVLEETPSKESTSKQIKMILITKHLKQITVILRAWVTPRPNPGPYFMCNMQRVTRTSENVLQREVKQSGNTPAKHLSICY